MEVMNYIVPGSKQIAQYFAPSKEATPAPHITQEQEDKAAADESELEARRRRRGALKRVFTQPGANFVSQSNIGKNTLTGS